MMRETGQQRHFTIALRQFDVKNMWNCLRILRLNSICSTALVMYTNVHKTYRLISGNGKGRK